MKRILAAIIIFLSSAHAIHASGIFGMGINTGVSTDGGTPGNICRNLNVEMHDVPGADVTEFEPVRVPVLGIEFFYVYQSLLIGIGWEYCSTLILNPEASIDDNTITMDYNRFTFPLTAGMAIPLSSRARFFFAGGFYMNYIMLQINQSSPGVLASMPGKEALYDGYVFGFLFKVGAEAVLSRHYSLAFQYTCYLGRTTSVQDQDKLSETVIGGSETELTVGIRYSLDLSM